MLLSTTMLSYRIDWIKRAHDFPLQRCEGMLVPRLWLIHIFHDDSLLSLKGIKAIILLQLAPAIHTTKYSRCTLFRNGRQSLAESRVHEAVQGLQLVGALKLGWDNLFVNQHLWRLHLLHATLLLDRIELSILLDQWEGADGTFTLSKECVFVLICNTFVVSVKFYLWPPIISHLL